MKKRVSRMALIFSMSAGLLAVPYDDVFTVRATDIILPRIESIVLGSTRLSDGFRRASRQERPRTPKTLPRQQAMKAYPQRKQIRRK